MSARLFIISAPSGAGKTTISHRLRQRGLAKLSISHTTRRPRRSEKNGEQYFFVDEKAFVTMRDGGEFLEWAVVFGHLYGSGKRWILRQLKAEQNVLLEVDWQGARQIKEKMPTAVSLFIRPPTQQALRDRLHARGEDSRDTINNRLRGAADELARMDDFDYVIINDDLDAAVEKIAAIMTDKQGKENVKNHR